MRAKILIVDDNRDILLGLENRIASMGHEPVTAENGKDALRLIEEGDFDLVLLDLELPFLSGLEVLERVRSASHNGRRTEEETSATYTSPLIVILTAFATIERAVQAMQLGAFDFITKPFSADHLTVVVKKALDTVALHRQVDVLRQEVDDRYDHLVGANTKMTAQLTIAKQAAASGVTVLLLGETGTGKEVVARAIHRWSPRRSKPFIAVNCAALPEHLLENELFGHEKGSFTGAVKREPGKIEVAEGGTVFLDEIGDMPILLQSRLLRVIQDQTFFHAYQQSAHRALLWYKQALLSLFTLPGGGWWPTNPFPLNAFSLKSPQRPRLEPCCGAVASRAKSFTARVVMPSNFMPWRLDPKFAPAKAVGDNCVSARAPSSRPRRRLCCSGSKRCFMSCRANAGCLPKSSSGIWV